MNERFQWTNFVFLRDGPKRGFVYEELLVVPANTKQQTLQRYSICSVWMLSGSFFCLLFIGEYHPCVYSNSCFRGFLQNSIQRGFVSLPAQFLLALRALFWGHFRLSFVVLHRAIPRLCRRTPAGTALAFALSICATQTILFCLLWTLPSCRGVLPLPHQDQPVITPVYELVQTVIIGLWVPELGHLVDRDPNFKRPVNLHLALLQLYFVHNIFQILKPHRSQIFPQNAFTLCLLHSRLSLKSFYELSIRAVVQKLQHLWQQRLLSFWSLLRLFLVTFSTNQVKMFCGT